MIDLLTIPPVVEGVVVVAVILVQAVLLYAGYAKAEDVIGDRMLPRLDEY